MPVLITSASVEEASETILSKNYFQRLNVTTIKGKTSCEQRKRLLNFMIIQVISTEEIEVTSSDCDCMKEEFDFTQSCSDAE